MTTQAEQYLLELINRARLDPEAEADRYGIDLNEDLAAGTISSDAKQVLAPNDELELAARLHSIWMLEEDVFSHTGEGGSSVRNRVEAADYDLSGSWRVGENISWRGSTGSINLESQIDSHHQGLFLSEGHRKNIMNVSYREVGLAQEAGVYTYNGRDYNASMLTQNYGKTGSNIFVTGVVYNDSDGNDFFSIGEGRSGATFSVGSTSTQSQSAGGYSIETSASTTLEVSISYQGFNGNLMVEPGGENVKVDLVDGHKVLLSKSATLLSGISEAELLGIANLNLQGSDADEALQGNRGNNMLSGAEGADTLMGGDGNDTLDGGDHADFLFAGQGDDNLIGGRGSDLLFGEGGQDQIYGGDGFDVINGGASNDTIMGGNGNDRLFGNLGFDSLEGEAGNDTIYGGPSGNDTLKGGQGADHLYGEAGADILQGDDGDDVLMGGTGNDQMFGGADDDLLEGGAGNDQLYGGLTGRDTMDGGQGSDFLFGEGGNDLMHGGDGFDLMNGGAGNDDMSGGNGNDRLEGNLGEDTLDGGAGDDELFGGNGAFSDTLIGGAGDDDLRGEAGSDVFIFGNGFGNDTIFDFNAFDSAEKIDLSAVSAITNYFDLATNHMANSGANVVISDGANSITILNVQEADLGSDDFILV